MVIQGGILMKRFLRMITLLGVLLIIGSCSSSKSVNTSEVTVGDGKLEVIFAHSLLIKIWLLLYGNIILLLGVM